MLNLYVYCQSGYYPFGMMLPNRNETQGDGYTYGFNGMEKDDEVKGEGNSYDFGARLYNPRVGRWLSRDPKEAKYPYLSSYSYSNNNPVIYKDINGEDWEIKTKVDNNGSTTVTIKVTAAVLNSSKNKSIVMGDLATAAKEQIIAAYSLKETRLEPYYEALPNGLDPTSYPTQYIKKYTEVTYTVEVEVEIRTISKKADIKDTEHLIEVVNDDELTTDEDRKKGLITLGRAPFNGKQIFINEKGVSDIINGKNKKNITSRFWSYRRS